MKVRLGDVCEKGSSNIAQKDLASRNGEYPIYGAAGLIKTVDFYQQEKEYIAIVKDGAGVGRTMALPARSSVIGTMQYIIPKDNISIKFLYYVISWMKLEKYCLGAAIPHIYFKDYKNEEFNLPTKKEQLYIVGRLDKVNDLIEKRKQQLEKLDLLVKSKFIEMFGDLKSNSKGWTIYPFLYFAKIDGQMITDYKKYANFPHIGIDSIEKETGELKGYRTVAEDGVISGKYLFSGKHIIYSKIRPNLNKVALPNFEGLCSADAYPILPNADNCNRCYLAFVMRSAFFLEYILQFSKRTNMPKVNSAAISGFAMPLPPIELQNEFATFVEQTDKAKSKIKQSLEKFDILKKALMQKYFG